MNTGNSGNMSPKQYSRQQRNLINRGRTLSGGLLSSNDTFKRSSISDKHRLGVTPSNSNPLHATLENNSRRFSSHLKPLDAQWIKNHHSHSVEEIVPTLARQKRIALEDRALCQQKSSQGRFSRSFCGTFSGCDSSQSGRASAGMLLPSNKIPQYFYRCPVPAKRHNSFGANSANNTPRTRHPFFSSYTSSIGSNATNQMNGFCMLYGPGPAQATGPARLPQTWASMQKMRSESSMPNSPNYLPYHRVEQSRRFNRIAPGVNRKVHSFDWSTAANFSHPMRHQPNSMQKFHSAGGGSVRDSFGASFSPDKDSCHNGGSPLNQKRQMLQLMKTSSSSTNSIIPAGCLGQNSLLLNPPDLVFSPASRRVSAVDEDQTDRNLVYNQTKRSQRRSCSQNLDDAPQVSYP
ncbi:hypothetical protein Ciccas_008115 [Cichlidogyrus casuarinus]|uniref:Uncharacterized protein n=1 Tax=Cichlidogyrus casuarinus TaxID=1844966 RepID=A0ABD2Q1D1_9PLAT